MRKVKIRSRLVACIGAVFALVLLVGAAVLKIQTQPASAKGSERQADTSFVLSSWGSVPAGGGYYTSLFKFYRNGQLMFHAYCASGNQNTPGIGGTYDVEVHKVDAETDPDDKFMKMFKIIYYSTQGGQHGYYGQAAIHWAVTAVNFGWTEQGYPYTVGAYPYKYINEPWPEGLSYGNVYYLNNDGNYTQSIVAAGWEKATTRTLNLNKVWLDSNGEPESEDVVGQHESVTVGVYKKLSEDGSGDALVGEVVLSKDSGWQGSIEVDDGYEYYVKEISSTPGYVMDSTCSKNSYVCKIVNTKLDNVRVSWEKTWEDHGFEANRPKSVKVAIQRTLNGVRDSEFGTKVFTMTESKCGVGDYKWHCYISGFDKNVEVDGQLVNYDYTVTEYIDYSDGLNSDVKYLYVEDESKRSITVDEDRNISASFTNKLDTYTVPIVKTWDDQGYVEKRPWLIVFNIYANGEFYDYAVIWNPDLWDTDEQDAFQWTVDVELPKTDKNGNIISYSFEEDLRSGEGDYEIEEIKNDNTGYEVINRRLVNINVIKCWVNDDEESRPSEMVFDLWGYTNHPRYHDEIVLTAADEVTEGENAGCWQKSVTGLPATYGDSRMDYYTVERELDDRYKADQESCEFSEENDFTCKFVNGRVVSVQVDKIWQNDDPKDRPGYIEVTLFKDGEQVGESVQLNNDNNWSYTWEDLEYGHDYTVTENIQIPKYKPGAYTYDTDENGNVFVKIYNAPETLGVKIGKYVLTISGVLLGGIFIARRAMARS